MMSICLNQIPSAEVLLFRDEDQSSQRISCVKTEQEVKENGVQTNDLLEIRSREKSGV
jgi:hypothetical protein